MLTTLLTVALADIVILPQKPTDPCPAHATGAACTDADGKHGFCKDAKCVPETKASEPPPAPPPAVESTKTTTFGCASVGTSTLAGGMVVGALGLLAVGRRRQRT